MKLIIWGVVFVAIIVERTTLIPDLLRHFRSRPMQRLTAD